MNRYIKNLPGISIGFVAGIAFLVSCGGSGGSSNTTPDIIPSINSAEAITPDDVNEQLVCMYIKTAYHVEYGGSTEPTISPILDMVTCVDQTGTSSFVSLPEVLSNGWIVTSTNAVVDSGRNDRTVYLITWVLHK